VRRALLSTLVLPLLLAGCASEGGGFGFQRADAPPDPFYKEHRAVVSGPHEKLFDVPVDARAALVNVTVALDARTSGLAAGAVSPAQLELRLLDPAGAPLAHARVDAREPQARLVVEDVAPGLHRVEVKGLGAAQDLDGKTYGASYLLTIEILYE